MKIYSIIGLLSYLILLYLPITWGLPLRKPSQVKKRSDLRGDQHVFGRFFKRGLFSSSDEQVKLVSINTDSLFSHVHKRASYDYSKKKVNLPSRQSDTYIYIQEVNKGVNHSQTINKTNDHRYFNSGSKKHSTVKSTIQRESTSRKFQHSSGKTQVIYSKEVDFASAQGLHQKLNEGDSKLGKFNMVLTIASTVAALFSMSLLVAIFQCCCRKKQKRNSTASSDSKSGNKVVASSENGVEEVSRKRDSQTENNEIPETSEDNLMDSQKTNETKDEKEDFRSKIKAFEVKKDAQVHPSPESVKPTKKRPGSEAFKVFENKGIIMGMGKVPKLQGTKESEEDEIKKESTPVAEDIDEETQEQVDKMGKVADNPDIVIASDDEEDQFPELRRETEVLKSYRKAAPPKGRNRSSRAFRQQQAEQSQSNLLFDMGIGQVSQTAEENKKNQATDDRLQNSEMTDKSEKPTVESTTNKNNTKEKSPSPAKEEQQETNTPGDNIFLQIDPTAKRKGPAVTPPVLRKKSDAESTGSRDSSGRKDKAKSSPLFLSNEKLMKDLEEKLKRQSSAKKPKESDETSKEKKSESNEVLQTAL